jgi:hypothetical protein
MTVCVECLSDEKWDEKNVRRETNSPPVTSLPPSPFKSTPRREALANLLFSQCDLHMSTAEITFTLATILIGQSNPPLGRDYCRNTA